MVFPGVYYSLTISFIFKIMTKPEVKFYAKKGNRLLIIAAACLLLIILIAGMQDTSPTITLSMAKQKGFSTTTPKKMKAIKAIRKTNNKQYKTIYRDLNKLYEEAMLVYRKPQITYAENMKRLRNFNKKLHNIREKLRNAPSLSAGGCLKVAAASLYFLYMNTLPEHHPLVHEYDFDHYDQEYKEWMEKSREYLDS